MPRIVLAKFDPSAAKGRMMDFDRPIEAGQRIRAAEYVRMSTEHQKYSTENQADVIREYAARRGYDVVKTYADDGKSGLRIEGRNSLRQLIDDVQRGDCEFKAVLVYDVSRWGRFQDSDESAYYEYICKRAGIQVVYCAEQFENDGSPTATIIKSVKRAMAGEYSRELSSKVFKGQCRLIQLGYRQGGTAGFGLRRMLIAQDGSSKGLLKRGEHKSLQTDRVVLVPGPADEVEVVRRIYRSFVAEHRSEADIALQLQSEGVPSETGRPWTRALVHQILTNEKYVGHNVYNRVSFKLKKKRVRNGPDMWVRADDAFEAVVAPSDFFMARGIIQERQRVYSNDELIAFLKSMLGRFDRLSAELIDRADGSPGSSTYRARFGSLIEAYRLAGFQPDRDYGFLHLNRRLRALYPEVVDDTTTRLTRAGASVRCEATSEHLRINDEFTAAVAITRCRLTRAGRLRWLISLDQQRPPDIAVIVRMDAQNERPSDYFLLPLMDFAPARLRLAECNGFHIDGYRFDTMDYLVEMSSRVNIEVSA